MKPGNRHVLCSGAKSCRTNVLRDEKRIADGAKQTSSIREEVFVLRECLARLE